MSGNPIKLVESEKILGLVVQNNLKWNLHVDNIVNKTLYRALTRWGYTNTHIAVYDTYRLQYTATVFQLRFKVVPELSGKVEYERERLNTVQKCNLVPKL